MDWKDAAVAELMDLLRGHPLAMRVVLTKLEKKSANELTAGLGSLFQSAKREGLTEEEAAVFAALRFATDAMPAEWKPLLLPLSLHEGFVRADFYRLMVKQADPSQTETNIDDFFIALVRFGLLQDFGDEIYGIHPLLTGFIQGAGTFAFSESEKCRWETAFVEVMTRLASGITGDPSHEQASPLFYYGRNFRVALGIARTMGMASHCAYLTQLMASVAINTCQFATARKHLTELLEYYLSIGHIDGQAAAYHMLGHVSSQQHDFESANTFLQKGLELNTKSGSELRMAKNCHELGIVAAMRRDTSTAEAWYLKSLEISERLGADSGTCRTCHQLGQLAFARHDLDSATSWFHRSLAAWERLRDRYGMGGAYHHLGLVAEARGLHDQAEAWFRKGLAIAQDLHAMDRMIPAFHHLGRIAFERRDFSDATMWFHREMESAELHNDTRSVACAYHHLGMVALEEGDFILAEGWYGKSIELAERLGSKADVAMNWHEIGILAERQMQWVESYHWFIKAIGIFIEESDERANMVAASLLRTYRSCPAKMRPNLQKLGRESGLPDEFLQHLDTPLQDPPIEC